MSKRGHPVTWNAMGAGAPEAFAVRHAPAGTVAATSPHYLNEDQVAFFWEHGYLRMEAVFDDVTEDVTILRWRPAC